MTDQTLAAFYAMRALVLKDLDSSSDDEIRKGFIEEGINPDELAASIATSLDEVVSASLREQAALAKAAMRTAMVPKVGTRPTLERIKAKIAEAFAADPRLATAFREGTKQSEVDLESLYEDLVLVGKIVPNDDAH